MQEHSLVWERFQFVCNNKGHSLTYKLKDVFEKKTESSVCPEGKKKMYGEYKLVSEQMPIGTAPIQD